jgi:hypothetical protein
MTHVYKTAGRWLAAPVLALALAGCASGASTTTTTPSATPTPTPTVPACPAGSWQSTQVTASAAAGGASANLQGGSGVKMTVGPDGAVTADFTSMQPITFTAQAAGAQAEGNFNYSGTVKGTITMPSPGASTTGTTGGSTMSTATATASPMQPGNEPWQPTGPVDFSGLKLTVKLTKPAQATLADNVDISTVNSAMINKAGTAVDLQPLLRPGQFMCSGETNLVITMTSGGQTVTWTFQRSS